MIAALSLNLTDAAILVFISVALILDAILLYFRGEEATISFRVAYWSRRAPVLAFLIGLLAGHLFWPNHGYCN